MKIKQSGFTFIELMVVVLLIAGLSLFAIPKFKEAQKRQASARSGGNLKVLNSALTQWDLERSGPPAADGTSVARSGVGPIPLKMDGSHPIQTALIVYVENSAGLWTSPNRNEDDVYQYAVFEGSNDNTWKGLIWSDLNGDPNYEPSGATNEDMVVEGETVSSLFMNGYEDNGRWMAGQPSPSGS